MGDADKYLGPNTSRLRDTELVYPVVVGTTAFFLGKKASEYHSHKWTVYVRGVNNEDISHIVQKVTFNLHSSFVNPARTIFQMPFELTETGWGEFEIGVVLHFAPDSQEKDLELFHRLKLYSDDDPTGQSNVKKPVVNEQIEDLVFSQPHEEFYNRVLQHVPGPAPPTTVSAYLPVPDESEDLKALQEARQKVAQMVAGLKQQAAADGGPGTP